MTLSSFLITTPQGNIVINSDCEETLPLMKKSIESPGFKMEDTKILLASHAHPDHQTADAMFKETTGAQTIRSRVASSRLVSLTSSWRAPS